MRVDNRFAIIPSLHDQLCTGDWEKISTARHSLGLHRSVAVTATYHFPYPILDAEHLLPPLYRALHMVVAQHTALSCGIVNEDLPNPAYVRLDEIDLRQCVFLRHVFEDPLSSHAKTVEEILSHQHSLLWQHLSTLPTWKLFVIPHQTSSDIPFSLVDIIFLFHHALLDGLSGLEFHRSLLKSLNQAYEPDTSDPIIRVSQSIILPPPVETNLCLQVTYRRLLSELFAAYLPAWLRPSSSSTNVPWTGAIASLPTASAYVSRVRVIVVPASHLRTLLQDCKQAQSTLTAAIHGIIILCLARLLPNAPGFLASTPYSVRNFIGTPANDMVNQVSHVVTTYPRHLLKPFQSDSRNLDRSSIYAIGSQFLRDLHSSKATFPVDNVLSLLSYLTDFHAYFRRQLGQARAATFEVSNLGVFRPASAEPNPAERHEWNIESLLFTQAGSVVGNALSFNCVSVEGGPLVVSLTWQEGAVEDTLAEDLLLKVEEMLNHISSDDQP